MSCKLKNLSQPPNNSIFATNILPLKIKMPWQTQTKEYRSTCTSPAAIPLKEADHLTSPDIPMEPLNPATGLQCFAEPRDPWIQGRRNNSFGIAQVDAHWEQFATD